jgi:hypothetical protein
LTSGIDTAGGGSGIFTDGGSACDFGISCIDGGSAFITLVGGELFARVFFEDAALSPEAGVPVVESTADRRCGVVTGADSGGGVGETGGFLGGGAGVFCISVSRTIVPPGPSPTSIREKSLTFDPTDPQPLLTAKSPATASTVQATAHMAFTIPPRQLPVLNNKTRIKTCFVRYSSFRPHSLIL